MAIKIERTLNDDLADAANKGKDREQTEKCLEIKYGTKKCVSG